MHYLSLCTLWAPVSTQILAKPIRECEVASPKWKWDHLLPSWCNSTTLPPHELATSTSTKSLMCWWWAEISTAIEKLWPVDGSQSTSPWIKQWTSATQAKGLWHGGKAKVLANFAFSQCLGCCIDSLYLSQEVPWLPGTAGNKSLLQGLSEAIGKFVSTETCMDVVCAPALGVHTASEFHTGCSYRHSSGT